jgi:hypothetical protein
MASNINTTTIDTKYPIAGQDNDSQGFRDNFFNINANFIQAKSEIEVMQNKVVFVAEFKTPSTADGAPGDVRGMTAFDASYMYACTADYVGVGTAIWKRVAISTW